ncbi:response regulator [Ferrimonas balearica]|uniref:response regulator n=1 Tax=Ferrimonas balearica TaxID=44012 RepID=UPI001C996B84|nr:response regulator [Ferrimonas balearica]MBY5923411.1 response regulator [Ferrimonas balearica]MBY5995161.1 response regulator [Ferrimonas balearica]
MAVQVLICDDSAMARKQLARNLPEDWDAEIQFAVDGRDALSQLTHKDFDLMFLDLNMPNLDGYGVLAELKGQRHAPKVLVVSADIQPLAYQKVMDLGALNFLRKPIAPDTLKQELVQFDLYRSGALQHHGATAVAMDDALREICNIAMGQAADNMAKVLGKFIELPVPKLRRLHASEMEMLLAESFQDVSLRVISQGFIGAGIAGEALLLFEQSCYESMGRLMGMSDVESDAARLEVQMDTANLLFASFLNGLSEQLHIPFCQSHPVVLSGVPTCQLRGETLAVEISYRLTDHQILCDLLLFFPHDSLKRLEHNLTYLLE